MNVPGFKVKRTIGRGGMATVYLAIQESLDREVVLKCMDSDRDGEKDFIDRFLNEGRIIASLSHPHIITVYDIGTVEDMVWIAMEYVGGGDLKARIDEGRMDPESAVDLVAKIGEALGYAHKHGIVHRDIKPANILFRNDGTALLTDFGIAKRTSGDSELTSTGTILGSPFYMSPEQAEGVLVDGRTDIYSLGVIFFELLTGQRPYQGDTAIKVIMQHIQSPVPRLPAPLKRYQPLLDQMMAKDRDERVPDARTMVREVKGYAEVRDNRESTGDKRLDAVLRARMARWNTRKRITTLGTSLLLVTAAMGLFYFYAKTLQNAALIRRPAGVDPAAANLAPPRVNAATDPARAVNGTTGSVTRRQVARALEVLARKSLSDDRLTQPPADNAHYYFSRLLALEPENELARRGFEEIAERFVVLAEKEFSRRNYSKAQGYIAVGLQVDPSSAGLRDLQSFIDNRERSLIDTFLSMFQGES